VVVAAGMHIDDLGSVLGQRAQDCNNSIRSCSSAM
jgi:hypothetical protein